MESAKKNAVAVAVAASASASAAPAPAAALAPLTWNGVVIFKLADIFDSAYKCKLSPEAYEIVEKNIRKAYYLKPRKSPGDSGWQLSRTYLSDQLIPSSLGPVCTYETALRILQALRSTKIVTNNSHLITKEIYESVETLLRQQMIARSDQDGSGSPCDVVMLADSGPPPNPVSYWEGDLLKRTAREIGSVSTEANKKPKIATVACFDAYSKAMTSYIEAHAKHVDAVKYLRASPVAIDAGIIDGVRERFVATTQPMIDVAEQYRNPK